MASGSRVDFANANNIFRLEKAGARFTPQTMAAARRIVSGNGNANDSQLIRQQLGIYKTGAGAARQQFRAVQATMGTIVQVGQSAEMISRGGTAGAVGVVNLVRLGSNEFDKIIRSKAMRSVFENVAGTIVGDVARGTRAYQSFRGAYRKGAALIEMALVGGEIVQGIQNSGMAAVDKRNARLGMAFDAAKNNSMDLGRSRLEIAKGRVNAMQEEGWMSQALRRAGFDTGYEDTIKARQDERTKQIVGARGSAQQLGVDVQTVLAQAASAKGKDVSELTDFERNEALDKSLQELLDPQNYMNDSRIDTELALQNPFDRLSDFFSNDTQMEAKRRRIAQEKIIPARLSAKVQRQKDAEYASELLQRAMTPTQRLMNRDAEERARAQFQSQRSRHQAWNND